MYNIVSTSSWLVESLAIAYPGGRTAGSTESQALDLEALSSGVQAVGTEHTCPTAF